MHPILYGFPSGALLAEVASGRALRGERITRRGRLRRPGVLLLVLRDLLLGDADERLPRVAVEQVYPARSCTPRPRPCATTPPIVDVEHHRRRRAVVVPDVMVDHLEVPPVLPVFVSSATIEDENRFWPGAAARPRVGVRRREVHRVGRRVDRRIAPHRGAARHPLLPRPRSRLRCRPAPGTCRSATRAVRRRRCMPTCCRGRRTRRPTCRRRRGPCSRRARPSS